MDVKLQAAPRLKLLLEFEPAHRVFFRNLGDAVLRREPPRIALTSRPGTFWNDVFIYSGKPWRSFFESILWHVFVVAVIWTVFLRGGPRLETAKQQQMIRDSRITYYAPSKSFPATESRRTRPRPQPKAAAHQQKIRVTPERTAHTLIMPPDLMLSHSTRSDSVISKVAAANHAIPAMPLAATGRSRRAMSAGVSAAVAPSPDVNQTSSRRLGLPQSAAVAPAPEVGAGSPRRAVAAPSSAIVAPPPTVQGSMRRAGDVNIGRSAAGARRSLGDGEKRSRRRIGFGRASSANCWRSWIDSQRTRKFSVRFQFASGATRTVDWRGLWIWRTIEFRTREKSVDCWHVGGTTGSICRGR
jgi:hypothetical protein